MNTWGILGCGSMHFGPGFMAMVYIWVAGCIVFFVNLVLIAFQPRSTKFWHLLFAGGCAVNFLILLGSAATNDRWMSMIVSISVYLLPVVVIAHFSVLLFLTVKRSREGCSAIAGSSAQK